MTRVASCSDRNSPAVFHRILAITYRLVYSIQNTSECRLPSRITHPLDLANLTAVAALCCSPRILLHASRSGGSGRCRFRRWHPRRPGNRYSTAIRGMRESCQRTCSNSETGSTRAFQVDWRGIFKAVLLEGRARPRFMGTRGTLLSARHAKVGSGCRPGGGQKDVVQILSISVNHFFGYTELSWRIKVGKPLFNCLRRDGSSYEKSQL